MSTVSTVNAADGLSDLAEGDVTRLRDRLIVECAHEAAQANDYRAAVAELAGRTDVPSYLERDFAEVAIGRSNEAIVDIFNALLRIDAGVYGMCEQCGGPISSDRLEMNPRERCCLACPPSRAQRQSTTHESRSR